MVHELLNSKQKIHLRNISKDYYEKDYYENDKERLKKQARNKYRNLSDKEKIKRENMEEIDITVCLKERNKN